MKTCSKCATAKDLSEFNRRGSKHQPYCRECQSDLHRTYYNDHASKRKAQVRVRALVQIQLAREYVSSYLDSHPCVDCGETNKVVLEFDHVRGKKRANIGDMVRQGYGVRVIVDEIDKCDVRCANHHRIVTAQRGGWFDWKSL